MLIKLPRMERTEENPVRAVKQLVEYLEMLVNQLEKELMQINNVNMIDLDLNDMRLFTDEGTEIASNKIKIKSPDGQVFEVGYDKKKKEFVFTMPKISSFNVGTINASKVIASTVDASTVKADSATISGTMKASNATISDTVNTKRVLFEYWELK